MSVFDSVLTTTGSPLETNGIYWFSEIARQADSILNVFKNFKVDGNPVKEFNALEEVVEYFNSAYLSRSPLEAIAKLLK